MNVSEDSVLWLTSGSSGPLLGDPIEEIHQAGFERVLGADDEQFFVLDQVFEDLVA